MKAARRLDSLPIYVFAVLDAKLKAVRDQGIDVIKLDIGSPDGPPPAAVIAALAKSRHFNLQEALVDAIIDLCLKQPGVIEARVSTEKPDVYKDCRVGYEAVRRRDR